MSVTPLKWTLRLIPKDLNLDKNPSYKTPSHFVPVLRGQSNNVFSRVPLLQVSVFIALVRESFFTSHKILRQLLGFWHIFKNTDHTKNTEHSWLPSCAPLLAHLEMP